MSYPTTPFGPVAATAAPSFFYHLRHRPERRTPATELTVEAVGDVDNLATVYDRMTADNGPAPGPDGVTYADLGRRELFQVLRPVSVAVRTGTYRPGPHREVHIPKVGRSGRRTLRLRNLVDRVVEKAVAEALTPYWEGVFLDGSYGYRPGRDHLRLLAALERTMVDEDRWVLATDDIRAAFDSVRLDLVVDDHRRALANNPLFLRLVETVLNGGDPNRDRGLDQGGPYSPTAMNVHLHHLIDARAHAPGANPGNQAPWYRYADNVALACRDAREGRQALLHLTQRLGAAGLALKGENGGRPVDLRRGGNVQLLGFSVSRMGGRVRYRLTPSAWGGLEAGLRRARSATSPHAAADAALRGWVAAHGPAFPTRQDRTASYLLRLASHHGFRETGDAGFYEGECRRAYHRWLQLKGSLGGKG